MAIEGEIYLGAAGETESLISTHAKEVLREFEETGRRNRTFDGTLYVDVTSRKYTFTIQYDYIDTVVLSTIYTKHALNTPLYLRMYISNTEYFKNFDGDCPRVRISQFSTTDFLTGKATKLYKNAPITFVEV